MSEEYGPDFVSVTDDEGNEFELEHLGTLEPRRGRRTFSARRESGPPPGGMTTSEVSQPCQRQTEGITAVLTYTAA